MTVTRPSDSSGFATVAGAARPRISLVMATGAAVSGVACWASESAGFPLHNKMAPNRTIARIGVGVSPCLLSDGHVDRILEQTPQLLEVDISTAERGNYPGSCLHTGLAGEQRRGRRGSRRFDQQLGPLQEEPQRA